MLTDIVGQGAQWPRMGARLLETFPSFAQTIRELDRALAEVTNLISWTIEGEGVVFAAYDHTNNK